MCHVIFYIFSESNDNLDCGKFIQVMPTFAPTFLELCGAAGCVRPASQHKAHVASVFAITLTAMVGEKRFCTAPLSKCFNITL